MIKNLFKTLYSQLKSDLHCPHKMALSICMGIYIAFSPFIALHTVMVMLAAWLLPLNGAVMFAISNVINNPWTLIPVYGLDYLCGQTIFYWLGIDGAALNPEWMNGINTYMQNYIALPHFSFWTFMVGGNVLGILVAVCAYPFVKKVLVQWIKQRQTGSDS